MLYATNGQNIRTSIFKFSSDRPVTFPFNILLLAGVIILQLDVNLKI